MHKPDPESLMNYSPSVVDIDGQGTVFVADANILDTGWLRVREWNGTFAKLPPHRVLQVRRLEVEHYGDRREDGSRPKRLADDEWRETAREWVDAENDQPDDAEQRVIA